MLEDTNMKVTEQSIKGIVKKFKTKTSQTLAKDENMQQLVEDHLKRLLNYSTDNLNILEDLRKTVLNKLDDVKSTADERMLLSFLREISGSIRAQNDSIRTLNDLLGSIRDTTKETEITGIEEVSQTVSILKDLERDGLIQILPAYYKSPMYVKEDDEEIEDDSQNKQQEVEQ